MLVIKSGIKIHPHKLRHYFAINAKDAGTLSDTIMRWLGHANVQMTNKYAHPNQDSVLKV